MNWTASAAATLENEHVLLRPVTEEDREALHAPALDPDIWRYFVSRVDTSEDYHAFFDAALADQHAGRRVVFVVIDKSTGRTAGSMSFGNMAEADRRLEIGWSWLGR
ncbi:GCN5 family acetyltransferase, partial [Streptomyces sp. NRRL B-1568]